MIELIVTSRLSDKIPHVDQRTEIYVNRRLNLSEKNLIRQKSLKRLYLRSLSENEQKDFFDQFTMFWDGLVKPFQPDHVFWRNGISSKMQEWERSAGYLAIALFTLQCMQKDEDHRIVVILESLQEGRVWITWAKKYQWSILYHDSDRWDWLKNILQEAQNILRFGGSFFLCLKEKWFAPVFKVAAESIKEKIFLIVSLFYPWSFKNGRYSDPFFGDLHHFLKGQGYGLMYLSDSLEPMNPELARNVKNCRDAEICTPYALVSWPIFLQLICSVFFRRIKIREAIFYGCDFARLLEWNARRGPHEFNLKAEIYHAAVSKLTKMYDFKRMILISEGNAFERGCLQALGSQGIQTIGYSHGVIFNLNLKLYRTPQEVSNKPDVARSIFTGNNPRRLFLKMGKQELAKSDIGCSLRYISVGQIDLSAELERPDKPDEKRILLALDGFWSSAHLLDWFAEYADILKEYKIILRAHPHVGLAQIQKRCLHQMPSNFEFSQKSLLEDLRRSYCVLYRHTSVGIQAWVNGVPAIHVNVNCPLSGDALEEFNTGSLTAGSAEELQKSIEMLHNLNENQLRELIEKARSFVADCFVSPTKERLNHFIKI